MKCDYCNCDTQLVTGKEIYPNRPDLYNRHFWLCSPCGAWVGTHKYSKKHAPLGRLANRELRKAKQAAHAVFDPLWKRKMQRDKCSKGVARNAAYNWLSQQMNIDFKKCHIGYFDVDQCKQVISIVENSQECRANG